jgi:hypothetical protein
MERKSTRALKTVDTSISVLLPCDVEERDGVTWVSIGDRISGRSVRAIKEDELHPRSEKAKEIKRTMSAEELNLLRGIKMLQRLRRKDDPLGERTAYDLVAPVLWNEPGSATEARLVRMRQSLIPLLSRTLRDVRLVFWLPGNKDSQGLLAGLYCPDLKTAVSVKWLLGYRVRVCLHCKEIFLADRPKQECCKIECREAHRVARWWERKRRRNAA